MASISVEFQHVCARVQKILRAEFPKADVNVSVNRESGVLSFSFLDRSIEEDEAIKERIRELCTSDSVNVMAPSVDMRFR